MADQNNKADISWIYQLSQGGPRSSSLVIKANPQFASNVSQRIEPYKSLPSKFGPALQAVADYMTHTAIPRTFKDEGPGWRPLAKRTQRERLHAGFGPRHPILIRTKDLFKELTEKSHPQHIEVIKTGANARVTIGGRSEKFIRNQLGNDALNLPARPMIPGTGGLAFTAEDSTAIKELMREKILDAVGQHG